MKPLTIPNFVANGLAAQKAVDQVLDLFGQEAAPVLTPRQKKDRPRGYAGTPGRGPKGESCGSCEFCNWTRSGSGKRFNKCGLVKMTRGPGTDIRRKSPACQFWAGDISGKE